MKNSFIFLILCSFVTAPALAKFTGVEGAITKIQNAQVDNLIAMDENTVLTDADVKAQDKAFDAISHAVVVVLKEPSDQLAEEILRATAVLLKKDPTQYAAEIILPLVEKNKAAYINALKKLSAEDAKLIEKAVKAAAREKKSGNG
ncbi:MAG: phosphoenolpyruvate carboxylase [Bdellovibrio sp.]|nr:phosphoenolpyruvate carboxylase [Bdellovibrio sp.]